MDKPLYVAHIITSANDVFNQKTCSLCVNDFIYNYRGYFENGRFVPGDFDELKVIYYRDYLDDGYAPDGIIVDLIQWMIKNDLWLPWMADFDQIAIVKNVIVCD